MRGAGAEFTAEMSQRFLKANGLKCILRSHQKRPDGYQREHVTDSGELLVATVFSASNYPSGAGESEDEESHGNSASVVVLMYQSHGKPFCQSLEHGVPWNESYKCMTYWTGPVHAPSTMNVIRSLHEVAGVEDEDPQVRALEQIKLLIYVHRGMLLRYFNAMDPSQTGMVSKDVFLKAMSVCLIHVQPFPWEFLAPYIATFDSQGMCRYAAFLGRYDNPLCHRLAEYWYGRALLRCVGDEEITANTLEHAQQEWDKIDKAKKGELSFQDLRPLLVSRSTRLSQHVEDERVFAILSILDADRSGFVSRDEFCRAVAGEGAWAINSELESRMADECWSAVQGVLVTLASTRLRMAEIFQLFDSDKSDIVSREEFREGLSKLLCGTKLMSTMDDWEPLFWKLLDTDESGQISPLELYMALAVEDKQDYKSQRSLSPKSSPRSPMKSPK